MSLASTMPLTVAEFLAWEEKQPLRYEFDGARTVGMTGGTAAHSAIQRNLAIAVGGRLRGKACQFHGTDLKIEVDGRIRYPDGLVVCSPPAPKSKIVRDPVLLFEVLSESTASVDIILKNREYAATASVQRYVILSQDEVGGTMFERAGGAWVGRLLDAESLIRMPEIGIEVPMVEFYEGVGFVPDTEPTSMPSPSPTTQDSGL